MNNYREVHITSIREKKIQQEKQHTKVLWYSPIWTMCDHNVFDRNKKRVDNYNILQLAVLFCQNNHKHVLSENNHTYNMMSPQLKLCMSTVVIICFLIAGLNTKMWVHLQLLISQNLIVTWRLMDMLPFSPFTAQLNIKHMASSLRLASFFSPQRLTPEEIINCESLTASKVLYFHTIFNRVEQNRCSDSKQVGAGNRERKGLFCLKCCPFHSAHPGDRRPP